MINSPINSTLAHRTIRKMRGKDLKAARFDRLRTKIADEEIIEATTFQPSEADQALAMNSFMTVALCDYLAGGAR